MESGFSWNLTFLIAPIEALLFPTIVIIVTANVIAPMEEAWLFPIAIAMTNTTPCCLSQSILVICGNCEGSK